MSGLNAHVLWTQEVKDDEGGVPLHSEFIVRKKVVGINYLWTTPFFRTMISEWRGTPQTFKNSSYKRGGSLFILKS